jgi:8-oxo-dGTP diphosphatase
MPLKLSVAVGGFLFVDNKALVVKGSLHEKGDPGVWEQPGGQVGDGEDPEQAIIREFKEETTLNIEIVDILRAFSIVYPGAAPSNHLIRIDYVVKLEAGEDINNLKLTKDHDKWKLVTKDEFLAMKPTLEHILTSGKKAFEAQNE